MQTDGIPWKAILSSSAFYGLLCAHCGFTWGFYTLLTEMPTYMDRVLNFNIRNNGLLSALPYFVMWIMCLTVSPIADFLTNRRLLTTTNSRKLFNSIGFWLPAIFLISLGFTPQEMHTLAIVLLTLSVGFNAASFCGYLINHLDLSPNYAGQIMGITNCISNLLSLCAPLVAGALIDDETSQEQWRIVFLITAGIYFISNLIFVIFGQASVQDWNNKTKVTKS